MTPRRAALAAVAAVVVLLVLAQLLLPRYAERRVREELSSIGTVTSVEVESFPAVELLAGEIDAVRAELASGRTSGGRIGDLIAKAEHIDSIRVTAPSLEVSGLPVGDARLEKDGSAIRVEGTVERSELESRLPSGARLQGVETSGDGVTLDGSFTLFGAELSGIARLEPRDGALVLAPQDVPFAGLATVTVFADPRLSVSSVAAEPSGSRLRMRAAAAIVP
jgi:LmeA-like phospholipid-binding